MMPLYIVIECLLGGLIFAIAVKTPYWLEMRRLRRLPKRTRQQGERLRKLETDYGFKEGFLASTAFFGAGLAIIIALIAIASIVL